MFGSHLNFGWFSFLYVKCIYSHQNPRMNPYNFLTPKDPWLGANNLQMSKKLYKSSMLGGFRIGAQ